MMDIVRSIHERLRILREMKTEEINNRRCPSCGKVVIKKDGRLYKGIKAFCSVHTTCENCNSGLVCDTCGKRNYFS